jgi:hypothetical protein
LFAFDVGEEQALGPMSATIKDQRALCAKLGARWEAAPEHLIVGMARNVRTGLLPLNGLRHPRLGDTTGWYIWSGEVLSSAPDFFEPVHVAHLAELCPEALKFLGLPPGWRFLKAGDHEDVWEDSTLLDI